MASLSMDEIYRNIKINHDKLSKKEVSNSISLNPFPNNQVKSLNLLYNSYNSSAAGTYSDNYANSIGPVPDTVRNTPGWQPSWPTSYKVYGSDCTNFVSQAIFKGTSYTSSDTNYFYPTSDTETRWFYKFSSTENGSRPWVSVGDLFNFLYDNMYGDLGSGPGGFTISICSTVPGQPIFMKLNGVWAHAVMVGSVNGCTNIRVNSHTTNYYREPLSTWSAYEIDALYIYEYYN
jgi:hypothetical protein